MPANDLHESSTNISIVRHDRRASGRKRLETVGCATFYRSRQIHSLLMRLRSSTLNLCSFPENSVTIF